MTRFSESVVEDAALDWLEALGWRVEHARQSWAAPVRPWMNWSRTRL